MFVFTTLPCEFLPAHLQELICVDSAQSRLDSSQQDTVPRSGTGSEGLSLSPLTLLSLTSGIGNIVAPYDLAFPYISYKFCFWLLGDFEERSPSGSLFCERKSTASQTASVGEEAAIASRREAARRLPDIFS